MDGYQGLKVWQLGIEISIAVYELTNEFPGREVYGLSSQLRRAAVSIPSNIAEGNSRGQTKDFIRFISIARGSVAELETQLLIAQRLNIARPAEIQKVIAMLHEEGRMLTGLRNSLRSKLKSQLRVPKS
jgi:four helix bundle protein